MGGQRAACSAGPPPLRGSNLGHTVLLVLAEPGPHGEIAHKQGPWARPTPGWTNGSLSLSAASMCSSWPPPPGLRRPVHLLPGGSRDTFAVLGPSTFAYLDLTDRIEHNTVSVDGLPALG